VGYRLTEVFVCARLGELRCVVARLLLSGLKIGLMARSLEQNARAVGGEGFSKARQGLFPF